MIKKGKMSYYFVFYKHVTTFLFAYIIMSSESTPHIIQSPIFFAIVIASCVGTVDEAMSGIPQNSAIRTISVATLADIASIHDEKSMACMRPYPMHVTHAE